MVKETQHIMTHLFFSFFFAKMKTLALSAIFIDRPVAVSTHHELSGILTLLAAMGYGGRGAKEGSWWAREFWWSKLGGLLMTCGASGETPASILVDVGENNIQDVVSLIRGIVM